MWLKGFSIIIPRNLQVDVWVELHKEEVVVSFKTSICINCETAKELILIFKALEAELKANANINSFHWLKNKLRDAGYTPSCPIDDPDIVYVTQGWISALATYLKAN